MKIEVWADIICPWCGLGLHRLKRWRRSPSAWASTRTVLARRWSRAATPSRSRNDGREATSLGATGVPFTVIDRRRAFAGAQSADAILSVLKAAV